MKALRGVALTLTFVMIDKTDPGAVITTGTPVESITIDNGTQAACTNAAAHKGNGQWSLVLTAAEMDADSVGVLVTLTNAMPFHITIYPESGLHAGKAQAGAAGTITLAAGASATDSLYNGLVVSITGGTGAGQSRQITAYNGTTKVATVHANWTTNPDSTSIYVVGIMPGLTDTETQAAANAALLANHLDHLLAADYDPASKPGTVTALLNELIENNGGVSRFTAAALNQAPGGGSSETQLASGTAQAGGASTVTLAAGSSAVDDFYNGAAIAITGGTGAGQTSVVTGYVGSTKVATVGAAWATNPDATSTYVLLPLGIIALTAAEIRAEADGAIQDNHLDHLFKTTYDPAAKPGAADALLNEIIENNGGVSRYTAAALNQAPGGGSSETQLASGTAQAGAASTVTLAAGSSAVDDFYNHAIIAITGGTGQGQTNRITDYVGATKIATVGTAWPTQPDNTSTYVLLPSGSTQGDVDTALSAIHLDKLLAADFDSATPPGNAGSLLRELIEDDAGVARFNANALEAIFTEPIETGVTLLQMLRLMGAAMAGQVSGAATTTITFKATGNPATTRIVATVDADGNRSSLTLTP